MLLAETLSLAISGKATWQVSWTAADTGQFIRIKEPRRQAHALHSTAAATAVQLCKLSQCLSLNVLAAHLSDDVHRGSATPEKPPQLLHDKHLRLSLLLHLPPLCCCRGICGLLCDTSDMVSKPHKPYPRGMLYKSSGIANIAQTTCLHSQIPSQCANPSTVGFITPRKTHTHTHTGKSTRLQGSLLNTAVRVTHVVHPCMKCLQALATR